MTTAPPIFRAAAATDPGGERSSNEDRVWFDESRGIFLVVDGVGGHAAGEVAAELAVRTIQETLDVSSGDIENRIRHAITEANNRIYQSAAANREWEGMACVLTLAVVEHGRVTVGHVGDSRLYLLWNGSLRKITSDHSVVGQQEERGELDELAAMRHPRRNEILRDIGSQPRDLSDPDFIQVKSLPFRADAALLLCTDGLSDTLTAAEINAIVSQYRGDPDAVVRKLIDEAIESGARDNVSAVFVAGAEFAGNGLNVTADATLRHSTTRMRKARQRRRIFISLVFGCVGIIAAVVAWLYATRLHLPFTPGSQPAPPARHQPELTRKALIDPLDSLSLQAVLASARAGERIVVPPGQYLGPLSLKDGIELISSTPRAAVVLSDPSATADSGIAILARGIHGARVSGFRIAGDETHPLREGVVIDSSDAVIEDTSISGAIDAGIQVTGNSSSLVLANDIFSNHGAGIVVSASADVRIVGNRIAENGRTAGDVHRGIEIAPGAHAVIENNALVRNGVAENGERQR
jgi:parallel beta-helix repeat protein